MTAEDRHKEGESMTTVQALAQRMECLEHQIARIKQLCLEIAKIDSGPIPLPRAADWFFNTNETYSKRAYVPMLEQGVVAVYGYPNAKERLDRPATGDRIFAYVNGHGIVAEGRISAEKAFSANSVFGKQDEREFHRRIQWDPKVDISKALSVSKVSQWGYNLPVRATLCRMDSAQVADLISAELRAIAQKT